MSTTKMNGYELSRSWFDFSFENPEKIKPLHTAIFFFAIEHCNRLGWKEKFGFPSQMVMEAIGVKNWRTYKKGLDELVQWGFILLIQESKNQYSSNIIAIVKNTKASTKSLDKALIKHGENHDQINGEDNVSITKPLTNKPKNKEEDATLLIQIDDLHERYLNNKRLIDAVVSIPKKNKLKNEDELKKYLNEFCIELKSKDKFEKTWNDFTEHFLNWVRLNYGKQFPSQASLSTGSTKQHIPIDED